MFLVALPAFIVIERDRPDPLLDLDLFRDRLFAMGNLTSLLNGIARNGVLFLLVFYLQGARGYDPVTAGIMLSPLAVGLLVLSPISGAIADRSGSRLLATAGMIVTGVGLLGLAITISVDTPFWQLALWQLIIGAGSGLFASPNTSAVMGVVPPEKRGMGAGARMMLTQVGFMVSIALALGLVTSVVPAETLLAVFSGTQTGSTGIDMGPFVSRPPTRVRCRRRREHRSARSSRPCAAATARMRTPAAQRLPSGRADLRSAQPAPHPPHAPQAEQRRGEGENRDQ